MNKLDTPEVMVKGDKLIEIKYYDYASSVLYLVIK